MSKFNASYFIKIFEAIPEERWATGTMISMSGAHCALGHLVFDKETPHGAVKGLDRLFKKYLQTTVPFVNDGDDRRWEHGTPRERMLSALATIKALRIIRARAYIDAA